MPHKIKRFISADAIKDWLKYTNFDRYDNGPAMSDAALRLLAEYDHYVKYLENEVAYIKREKDKSNG